MNIYLKFLLIASYMVITYHIIALKYRKSQDFSGLNLRSKILLIAIHVTIVISNISLYLWFIILDLKQGSFILRVLGILMFIIGIFIILWSIHSLRKAVFVPGNKLIVTGPYATVRHPMYLGGITGAFGLALFAGSLLALIYSSILAAVLSHIADAEEDELKARFGIEYVEYGRKVPRIFPYAW